LENGILKVETFSQNQHQDSSRFISLQMESCPALEVIAKLQALKGVLKATNPQKNEFIVAHNAEPTAQY